MFVLHKNLCERTSWNDRGFTSITGNPSGSWSLWTLWESKLFVTQIWNLMGFLEFLFLNLWFTKCIIAIFLLICCAFKTRIRFFRQALLVTQVSPQALRWRNGWTFRASWTQKYGGKGSPWSGRAFRILATSSFEGVGCGVDGCWWDVEVKSARGFWSALFVWS